MAKRVNPKRTKQQLQGSIGATAFELFVTRDLKWLYRPVHQEHDFGIDGYIDIVEEGRLTGASLAVQIKCGNTYLSKRSLGGVKYEGEIKHLNYYYNLRQPILLVVLDDTGQDGRWVQFGLDKTVPALSSDERWWIEIPDKQTLDPSVAEEWKHIAGPTRDVSSAVDRIRSRDFLTHHATSLALSIRKNDVLQCDLIPLFMWQSQLTKTREMMVKKHASVEFSFEGWRDDKRELYEVPEIRDYYAATMEAGFPWLYWLEPDVLWQGYMLLYACGCDIKVFKDHRGVGLAPKSPEAMKQWIDVNFDALNRFTEANEIPEHINKECSKNLIRFLRTKVNERV